MQLISTITNYMYLIIIAAVIIIVAVIVIAYYLLKVKKIATTEEHPNYDSFERTDATEYSKFMDIISSNRGGMDSGLGMIHTSENTFVAGIEVSGYNFYGASAEERERTMINMIAFFNTVEAPIQMRQTIKAIDIESNIRSATEDAAKIERKLIDKTEEYNQRVAYLNDDFVLSNQEVFDNATAVLDKLQKEIQSLKWQLAEATEVISYMRVISDRDMTMRKINQIMFSYTYNPDEQMEELSKEEIYIKAENELYGRATTLGGAIENCGCSWRVLTADDLVGVLRRHYHPDTADSMKLSELLNSSYSALYVSSDAIKELEKERVGEIEYERQIAEYERQLAEQRKLAAKRFHEEQRRVTQSVMGQRIERTSAKNAESENVYYAESTDDGYEEEYAESLEETEEYTGYDESEESSEEYGEEEYEEEYSEEDYEGEGESYEDGEYEDDTEPVEPDEEGYEEYEIAEDNYVTE